ncbi:hypothetical protein MRX96_001325 [Rhipicephalus microplus]
MHRAPPPVTGASNPSRTSPGPIEHKNRRQPPVQQTPNHNNDAEFRALREEVSRLKAITQRSLTPPTPSLIPSPPTTQTHANIPPHPPPSKKQRTDPPNPPPPDRSISTRS